MTRGETDDNEKNISSLCVEGFGTLEKRYAAKKPSGILTGFEELDNLLTGLHRGDLIILGSSQNSGNSPRAIGMIANIATRTPSKPSVTVFPLGMTAVEWVNRLAGDEGSVAPEKLGTGRFSPQDWSNLATAFSTLCEANMFVEDGVLGDVEDIIARSRTMQENAGLDVIFIDNLQLLSHANRFTTRADEVDAILRSLKRLARELKVSVIVSSQLLLSTESNDGDRPPVSDLPHADAIYQIADVICLLHHDEVNVVKNANGSNGCVRLPQPDLNPEMNPRPATTKLWLVRTKPEGECLEGGCILD